jgi:hypothetical protein
MRTLMEKDDGKLGVSWCCLIDLNSLSSIAILIVHLSPCVLDLDTWRTYLQSIALKWDPERARCPCLFAAKTHEIELYCTRFKWISAGVADAKGESSHFVQNCVMNTVQVTLSRMCDMTRSTCKVTGWPFMHATCVTCHVRSDCAQGFTGLSPSWRLHDFLSCNLCVSWHAGVTHERLQDCVTCNTFMTLICTRCLRISQLDSKPCSVVTSWYIMIGFAHQIKLGIYNYVAMESPLTVHVGPKSVTHQQAFNHTLLPNWHGMLADVWLWIG